MKKKEILEAYNKMIEEEIQQQRINSFLERNGLKIEDLKKMLEVALDEIKETK
jgi:hypothetical protein